MNVPESGDGGQPQRRWSRERRATAALAAMLLALVGWRMAAPAPQPSGDRVLQRGGWADERRCAECHEQAEQFGRTGHARTLSPAGQPDLVELLQQLAESPGAAAERTRIEVTEGEIRAVSEVEGAACGVDLDWCFGSGRHARTWVGLLTDSWGMSDLVEFRWTWYSETGGFDVTPGQPEHPHPGYFGPLGMLHDHPKTVRCFGCHATRLGYHDGGLSSEGLLAGVTCQRCHGPRGRHVESEGRVSEFTWRGISQLESVHRCAECHRRAEEQQPHEIRPDNPDLARFQPAGLVQSACFRKSNELTCLSCHDPHRPLEAQDSLGDWQCLQCHDATSRERPACGLRRSEDCVRCHMPRVRGSSPLHFTDHWIRVRPADGAGR